MTLHKPSSLAGIFILALLSCLLGACGTSQNIGSVGGSPSTLQNPSVPIKTIRMLDRSKGWALTDQNILSTSDGGQTWKDVTPSGSIYGKNARGDFMSDKYAWVAVTPQQTGNNVTVLRTSDGGQHWQSSTVSASEASVGDVPHFLTTQEGFLELVTNGGPGAGSEAVGIFHTTDGGQNWTEVSDTEHPGGLPHGGIKNGITFKDAQNGWATGEDASLTPWLYVTHDGGHTWKQQLLENLPGSIGTASTNVHYTTTPPVFFGNNGFLPIQARGQLDTNAASQINGFIILQSTDGGATWYTDWKANPNTLTTFASSDLYIESVHNAWATDQSGNVYGTSDAGENWSKLASNVDTIKALSFVDTSYGWAVSDTKLWQTTDGGHHWNEVVYHIIA
jgi:photosystem II stability/assembly factor-like uncharacterized protein